MQSMQRLVMNAAATAMTTAQENIEDGREQYRQQAHSIQENFMPKIKRAVYLMLVSGCLFVSSLATYGLFYLVIMPSHHATEPLYFDYSGIRLSEPTARGANHFENMTTCRIEETSRRRSEVDVEDEPRAVVDLFARHTTWEAYQEDVIPHPITKRGILQVGQAYFLEVALVMPETDKNRQAGMFGVMVELRSHDVALASSIRSARLPYESSWVGVVRKLVLIVPLLLGALTESRTVVVPSYHHFVESRKHRLRYVVVRLIMPQNTSSDPPPVEIVAGEVRIGKELKAVQRVLKEWYFTCYTLGTIVIFVVQVLMWLLFQTWWEQRRRNRPPPSPRQRQWEDPRDVFARELGQQPTEWDEFTDGEIDDEWDDMPPQSDANETQPATNSLDARNPVASPNDLGHAAEPAPPSSEGETESGGGEAVEVVRRAEFLVGEAGSEGHQAQDATQRKAEEALLAERVMKGHIDRYEIFTDHDDPDL